MANKRERRIASWRKYCRYSRLMIRTGGQRHVTNEELAQLLGALSPEKATYEIVTVRLRLQRRRIRLRRANDRRRTRLWLQKNVNWKRDRQING